MDYVWEERGKPTLGVVSKLQAGHLNQIRLKNHIPQSTAGAPHTHDRVRKPWGVGERLPTAAVFTAAKYPTDNLDPVRNGWSQSGRDIYVQHKRPRQKGNPIASNARKILWQTWNNGETAHDLSKSHSKPFIWQRSHYGLTRKNDARLNLNLGSGFSVLHPTFTIRFGREIWRWFSFKRKKKNAIQK